MLILWFSGNQRMIKILNNKQNIIYIIFNLKMFNMSFALR